jgi:hypothetical protein
MKELTYRRTESLGKLPKVHHTRGEAISKQLVVVGFKRRD